MSCSPPIRLDINFMSWLPDWITGYDSANGAAAAAADTQLQAMNAVDYAPGGKFYTPENAAAVQAQRNLELSSTGGYGVQTQQDAIQQTFDTTLQDQANKIIGGPFSAIGDVLKSILKALPWWLWFVVAAGAFVWLGGPVMVKGIFAGKKK